MTHKQQLLHELLKEDQEPFQLHTYISHKRSQLKKQNTSTTTLQLNKRKPITNETSTKLRNLCFFSFQNSPLPDLLYPAPMSPYKSPNGGVFIHIPSRTAATLVEAAMRIQKPRAPSKNVGFGLFGSFLKRFKNRKYKKRVIGDNDLEISRKNVRKSCSSSADWTKSNEEKSRDFGTSTSFCSYECSDKVNDDFDFLETRFRTSPFIFSLQKSSSFSGSRTPDFYSPATSPIRCVKQEMDNSERQNSGKVQDEKEKEEQCSPVSVLDRPFEDDDEQESQDSDDENDDYHHECSYSNVQRRKQQLLYRLRRFEKLAELDPLELETKLLEESDCEKQRENDEPLYKTTDSFVTEVFNQSSLKHNSITMSTDMKRLISDLIIEEKNELVKYTVNSEVVLGRICNKLDSWKEVEFDTIDMMIGLDFKREFDGWKKLDVQREGITAEIELAVLDVLMEELSEELLHINYVSMGCI